MVSPVYLFLLPLFFVMHGFNENFELIAAKDAFILFLLYMGVSALVLGLSWLVYRNLSKAGFFSFLLMSYFFFFGSAHDFVKKITNEGLLSRYTFILPVSLLLILLVAVFIRKRKRNFTRTAMYLNTLLGLLIILETGILVYNMTTTVKIEKTVHDLKTCPDCPKPDIFLIIADSYPGKIELKEELGYDNASFEKELSARGFYISDSSFSNYNSTPFSVASMLNMDYLYGISGRLTKKDVNICYKTIRQASAYRYLRSEGYEFFNHSLFDIGDQQTPVKTSLLMGKTSTITAQTFLKRIDRDLGHNLVTRLNIGFIKKWVLYRTKSNNERVIEMTGKILDEKDDQPRFVYTHVMMPHYPYYYDSTGVAMPDDFLVPGHYMDEPAFVQYLVYTNKKLLTLIDRIRTATDSKAIIILAGDHGFREFKRTVDFKYHFMNLNAVYLPDKNYSSFYPGLSNVNLFRLIFNTQFRQQLPLLKDSTSFIID